MKQPTEWISVGKVAGAGQKLQGVNFAEVQLIERRIDEIKELADQLINIYNTNGGNATRRELIGILEDDEYTVLNASREKINNTKVHATQVKCKDIIYKKG